MEHLELKIGARVILVVNDDLIDNLVNGVPGKVVGFAYRQRPGVSQKMINAIIVAFDEPNIGEERRRKYHDIHPSVKSQNGVPIFRITQQFK